MVAIGGTRDRDACAQGAQLGLSGNTGNSTGPHLHFVVQRNTGMGLVSPLGSGVETVWARLLSGRSGLRNLPDDVVADLPAKVGGAVPTLADDAEAGFDPDRATPPKEQKKMDRFILFALAAAKEALAQAGWAPQTTEQQTRTATIIASGVGGFPAIAEAVRRGGRYAHQYRTRGADGAYRWQGNWPAPDAARVAEVVRQRKRLQRQLHRLLAHADRDRPAPLAYGQIQRRRQRLQSNRSSSSSRRT